MSVCDCECEKRPKGNSQMRGTVVFSKVPEVDQEIEAEKEDNVQFRVRWSGVLAVAFGGSLGWRVMHSTSWM